MKRPLQDSSDLNRAFKFLIQLPKTEIHLHLEGMMGPNTAHELLKKAGSQEDFSVIQEKFNVENLEEFIALFTEVIQPAIKTEADLGRLMEDARAYFKRNRIYYAEVFFAPSKFLMNGLSFEKMIRELDESAGRIKAEDGIEVKFITDVSRGFGPENAMKNLDLSLKHKTESLIGIGLGGAEARGPARDYVQVFEKAVAAGLHVVAHAGEDVGPESIWDAVNLLKAERIGHGISAIQDEALMDYLKENNIPLEICPTSNVFTRKYVHELAEHPLRKFFDAGLPVTLNSDDPGVFWVELVDEYMNVYNECGFTLNDLVQLVRNGLEATFMPEEQKQLHRTELEQILRKIELDPSGPPIHTV